MDEFELIRQLANMPAARRGDVILGMGDDAALLVPRSGWRLVATTDNLVAGVHFPESLSAASLGHRSLAVNLSDLAAMGAEPAWALLTLTMSQGHSTWLHDFADGFWKLASRFGVSVVGGNMARGPSNIGVTLLGWVESGMEIRRTGAAVGDGIWVTGRIGAAGLGLRRLQGGADESDSGVLPFSRPEPRIWAGRALAGVASSGIDISDGLLADLAHLLSGSALGADLELSRLETVTESPMSVEEALGAGDDYELCVTVPAKKEYWLSQLNRADLRCSISRIGTVTHEPQIRLVGTGGEQRVLVPVGYRHFK